MKLLLLNSVCGIRSTGRIVADIAREYETKGWEVRIGYGRIATVPESCKRWAVRIGGWPEVYLHALLSRLWHGQAFRSTFATRRFLRWASEWNPDELWMHSLGGYYINRELLFNWIKSRPQMKVRWTLHDCSAFTGDCGNFLPFHCEQWRTLCKKCPVVQGRRRGVLLDFFLPNAYRRKKNAELGVKDMQLITPSKWLAGLVKQSFLSCYPVEVKHNTIDTNVFRPTPSDFRKRHGLENAFVILGVAWPWRAEKGLEDFVQLAQMAPDNVRIVIVGLSEKQIQRMPAGVVALGPTRSPKELAEIYSAADVFFNPSQEENYPTVNLEARACGCRVIVYDTGGSAETLEGYAKAAVLYGAERTPSDLLRVLGFASRGRG